MPLTGALFYLPRDHNGYDLLFKMLLGCAFHLNISQGTIKGAKIDIYIFKRIFLFFFFLWQLIKIP
jgi:hypothetical protein